MTEYAVAAIGNDRPGIVAAVAGALEDIDASIEDSSMTILGGHFAMLLLVESGAAHGEVEQALRPVADRLGLLLEVRETTHGETARSDSEYVISAYGPDRPGLVRQLAGVLAEHAVNITDFGSRVTDSGTFAMWFNVELPAGEDADELTAALQRAGAELQLEVGMRAAELEAL